MEKSKLIQAISEYPEREKRRINSLKKAIFNLNDDGTANESSLTNLNWNMNHESKLFERLDDKNEFLPLFVTNVDRNGAPKFFTVAAAAKFTNGARTVLFSRNPFIEKFDGDKIAMNEQMEQALKNTIKWAVQSDDLTENDEIILTNMSNHENQKRDTKAKIAKFFPNAVLKESCDIANPENCVSDKTRLVIIGSESPNNTCVSGFKNFLSVLKERKIPVFYTYNHWGDTACSNEASNFYGVKTISTGNYFSRAYLKNQTPVVLDVPSPEEQMVTVIEKMEND